MVSVKLLFTKQQTKSPFGGGGQQSGGGIKNNAQVMAENFHRNTKGRYKQEPIIKR